MELLYFLPPAVTDKTGLTADEEVEVTCENGAVVARPIARSRYTLAELVSQITHENRHPETDTSPVVMREE